MYVGDDLDIAGRNSNVVLKGHYRGYGNENTIIAIKVNDYDLFKKKLNIYNGTKTPLHEFEEYDINKLFVNVGYDFKNINTSDDYQSLVKTKKMSKNKR